MIHPIIRTYHFIFLHVQRLIPFPKPEILEGEGSLLKIPDKLKENGRKKILMVTTAGTIKRGTLDAFLSALKRKNIDVITYTDVPPNPTILSIEEGTGLYKENQCDAIVAVGGGSVMDCAKVIGARVARPNKSVSQMKGLFKVLAKLPESYMVPTTAGTGSEITVAAVVTDSETHYKYAVNDFSLLPKYAILDPNLLISLSPSMTAQTGMDALTHAVEAYTNIYSERESNELALSAVIDIFNNLEKSYKDGSDITLREKMLKASFNAGKAFTRAYVGYVHAIAHAIGGIYGVPHGLANSVILPIVLEEFGASVYKSLSELAKAVHLSGATDEELAKAFIAEIRRMNKAMNIPTNLPEINESDIPKLARRAVKEANPTYPVPKVWTKKEIEEVIRKIKG